MDIIINNRVTHVSSSFLFACKTNNTTTVSKLLDIEHAIIRKNNYEMNILDEGLMIACENGNVEVVKELIKNGANIDYIDDENDQTLLDIAVRANHEELVRYLLQAGISTSNFHLDWAEDNDNILQILLDHHEDVNKLEWDGEPALWVAISDGNENLARKLLDNGANVNTSNLDDKTVLMKAIKKRDFDCVALLVEYGAKLEPSENEMRNNEDNYSWPLYIACQKRCYDIVLFLLEKDAKVALPFKDLTLSPIHFMCRIRDKEANRIVIEMLKRGDCVNAESAIDLYMNFPIDFALADWNEELVWILMLSGADKELAEKSLVEGIKIVDNKSILAALRNKWTPDDHIWYPKEIKDAVMSLLMIAKRQQWKFDTKTLNHIFSFIPFGWYTWQGGDEGREPKTKKIRI